MNNYYIMYDTSITHTVKERLYFALEKRCMFIDKQINGHI
jgi:hypothetical protein